MAFDEHLAGRIRAALQGIEDVQERHMFGGVAFMVGGHMACGIVGSDLMVRLGRDGTEVALAEPHVRPMDFTGRPSATMVYVDTRGTATGGALTSWVGRAVDHARTLPQKPGPARASKGA